MSTVPAIAAAESALVAQVRTITAALQGVASGPLDAALLELKREADAAADRIAGAREFVAACLSEVVAAFAGLTAELSAGAAVNLPAPEGPGPLTAAAVEAHRQAEEPAVELGEEVIVKDDPAREWPESPLPPAQMCVRCEEFVEQVAPLVGGLCDGCHTGAQTVTAAASQPAANGRRKKRGR